MYERMYGEKYDGKLSTVEIAKLIRKDIKEHIEKGCLPDGKYSVRSKYFSGGSSIDVHVSNLDHEVYTKEYIEAIQGQAKWDFLRGLNVYTAVAKNVLTTVKAIMNQYNHDGSDIQSDYFDVNFYGDVTFDWQWMKATCGIM